MDDQQNRTTKKNGPHQDTIARPEIDKTKTTGEHERQTNSPTKHNREKPNIWMTILTGIIAVATVVNVAVFYFASKDASEQTSRLIVEAGKIATSMNETVAQAKTAMETGSRQNEAALKASASQNKAALESSAKQAQAALDASRDAANLDQRAWVGLVSVETQGGEQTRDDFSFKSISVAIRNSGKTPALKLSGECCMFVKRPWAEPIPDYDTETKRMEEERRKIEDERRKRNEDLLSKRPEIAARIREFEQAFAASATLTLHTGGVLAPGIINNIRVAPSMKLGRHNPDGPPLTLYVLGKFTYNDIFTGTQRHATKFCLMYTGGNSFTICPESNWMD